MTDSPQEIRIRGLEHRVKDIENGFKELNGQVNGHAVTIAEIKVMVTGLQASWAKFETDIRQALEGSQKTNTQAWKDVTIQAIKTIGTVAGVILAAKIFLGGK